jgi:anti-sigma B factor antagonist
MSVDPVDQQVFSDGPLFVTWHRYGRDVLVISLAGELDESNVATVRQAIYEATEHGDDEILVVDLSTLEFIDSSGIAVLFALADLGGDGRMRIVPSRAPGVERVLRLTGLADRARLAREHPLRAA